MPKSRNQKLKLLCLKDILENYTDDNNKLSTNEIIEKLSKYGISAERKSIYDDIECLKYYGLDIITEKTDSNRYYIGERTFELPELKLLVDSVQSSKFLTVKKLIKNSSLWRAIVLGRSRRSGKRAFLRRHPASPLRARGRPGC